MVVPDLTTQYNQYRMYAEEACALFSSNDERVIQRSVLLPEYTKQDRVMNRTRATAGKFFLKTALWFHSPMPSDAQSEYSLSGLSYPIWSMLYKMGFREWNKVFLPSYKDVRLDSTFLYSLGRMVERGVSGFDGWRQINHPELEVEEAEQSSRMAWFAMAWGVMQGRRDLSQAELDAIWNYAVLYPLIDNFIDSENESIRIHRQDFMMDLRKCLADTGSAWPTFSYHPRRAALLQALGKVKSAIGTQPNDVTSNIIGALEILLVVEEPTHLETSSDILFHSCMKGTLALLPVCMLINPVLQSEDYKTIFKQGLGFQLIDDMQDYEQDRRKAGSTLYTATHRDTDALQRALIKTLNFLSISLKTATGDSSHVQTMEAKYFGDCLGRIMTYLAIEAILTGPGYAKTSYQFIKSIKPYSPFSVAFMQKHHFEHSMNRIAAHI